MLDSNHRPLARVNAGARVRQITFYAIFLRHWLANRRINQAELDTSVLEPYLGDGGYR
jgi:hypothetical protein